MPGGIAGRALRSSRAVAEAPERRRAPHGIRVNVVCPGGTITPYHVDRAAARGVSETELHAQRSNDNLLGRWAEPREVAHPIHFLASDDSSFITGTTLMVDAGRSIL